MEAARKRNDIFKVLKEKKVNQEFYRLMKLSFKNIKIKTFLEKEKLIEFTADLTY